MKFVFIVAALLWAFAFSNGKLPLAKTCCLRGKTRDKYVWRGQMISLLSLYRVRLTLVGILIIYINLEINKQINWTSSVEISSPNITGIYWGPRAISLLPSTWPFQCDEPHSYTRKAISSLWRSGEKYAFVSTRNAMVHQFPAKRW